MSSTPLLRLNNSDSHLEVTSTEYILTSDAMHDMLAPGSESCVYSTYT